MKTVIEMAREAGFLEHEGTLYTNHKFGDCFGELERFAELVRADERERIYFQTSSDFVKAAIADEREACAKVCDIHARGWEINPGQNPQAGFIATSNCAAAIRARSNT